AAGGSGSHPYRRNRRLSALISHHRSFHRNWNILKRAAGSALFVLAFASPAFAQQANIDTGDTAWMLTSTALVLMMTTPGLALFYGGMVRQKNALGTLMQSFIIMALISVQWVLVGYSLAFGPDKGGIIGGLEWIGLRGVGAEPFDAYSKTIPHQRLMAVQ